MTPVFVLFEMQGFQVRIAEAAKERGFHTVVLNHDPLRTTGAAAVAPGVVDEVVPVVSWSDVDTVPGLTDNFCRCGQVLVSAADAASAAALAASLADRVRIETRGPA